MIRTLMLGLGISAIQIHPTPAQIPTHLSRQCRVEIQSSLNNFRRGRSVVIYTRVEAAYNGHPLGRPQMITFGFQGPATDSLLRSEQMLMATIRRVIQRCPTISAVRFGEWGTAIAGTGGLVNGNIQWFECKETDPSVNIALEWGNEACQ
jgi:hypothetical protein